MTVIDYHGVELSDQLTLRQGIRPDRIQHVIPGDRTHPRFACFPIQMRAEPAQTVLQRADLHGVNVGSVLTIDAG